MKYVLHIIFLVVFSVISPTWLEHIEILGIKPNLFLVYIILISCNRTKKEGAIVGFFFGLILDLFVGTAIGLNAVLMLILSFTVNDFCEKFIRKNTLVTSAIIVFTASLLYEFVYYVIAFLGDLKPGSAILRVIFPESIYSALCVLPLYFIIPGEEKSEQL